MIREVVKDWEILEGVYEYDIPFKKRYLIDKGITPLVGVEAEGSFVTQRARVPVLKADKVRVLSEESLEEPRILAFDIETYSPEGMNIDPEKNPIIMLAFYGNSFKRVITWKKFKANEEVESVDSEAELIEKFKEVVEHYKPDILTGYYSDGFDLPYIKTRADKYKIKLDIGLDFSELRVKKGQRDTTAEITGIIHLDIFKFIRKIKGPSMDTFAFNLNMVAEELIGEKKLDVEMDNLSSVWDNHPEKLGPYADYNLHDAYLAYKLTDKMMPTIIEMVKIVGLTIDEVHRMGFSQLVESFLLKNAPHYDVIAPNKPHHEELRKRMMQTFKGAFVFEPKPGLYKDITVFDYRSLYPSIISSHNISPGTLNCECCEDKAKTAPSENKRDKHWFCGKKKGFIPLMIEELITRRMRVKDILQQKSTPLLEARSQALKLLANSFYGYLGFSMSRWYSIECSRSITAYGRYYIHSVIDKAEKAGFKVLYGDTDSTMITLDGKTKKDAEKFREELNNELPGLMELEHEGFYPAGIFVSAKAGKFGAKKKYALLSESGNLKIRGFETVRRNWSPIAKQVQENVLSLILKENKPAKAFEYVRKVIDELKENKVPLKDVIIYTQLQKEIKDYDAVGPHVAIASLMKEKGISVGPGSRIEFVITKKGDKIRDKARLPNEVNQEDYDPEYYINNQVVPAVEKIFEVLGYSKNDLVESKEQNKLSKFF